MPGSLGSKKTGRDGRDLGGEGGEGKQYYICSKGCNVGEVG